MDARIRILHVDDEPEVAELVTEFLEREDDRFAVETVPNAAAGLERLADGEYDCVVSDYDMPGLDGIEFLEAVRETHSNLPFILYTGKGSEEVASGAVSAGATDYLQKESGTEQYELLANRIDNAVSARRSADEAIRSRRRLEQILKTVPACVVRLDRDGRFVFANERAEEVLGLDSSSLNDRTYDDPAWQITDLDGAPVPDEELPFRQVRETGEPLYGYRHAIEWPDDTRRILEVNGAPLFDHDGDVESVVFSLSDVTEQRARERRLERCQTIVEATDDAAFVVDDDWTVAFANEASLSNVEVTAEAVYGRSITRLIERYAVETEASDRFERALRRAFEAERSETFSERLEFHVEADGETRASEYRFAPVVEDGTATAVAVTSRDVTERVERERQARRYRRMVDAAREAVCIYDSEGRFEVANDYLAAFYDTTLDALEGTESSLIQRIREEAEAGDPYRELLDGDREVLRGEVAGEFPGHGYAVLDYRLTRLVVDGEVDGVVGVARDVTERTARERELERQNERLEEFASVVSHDLRNPLTVAEGRLEMAREDCDSDHLAPVVDAHERMRTLIDDLLTLARQGEAVDETATVDLAGLAETCWTTVAADGATLLTDVGESGTIRADRDRLRQLLENLLRNAVEHGGEDVTVTVGTLADEAGFYVADDGPGIPPGERDRVLESGYSTASGGTGFGLSIVQQVARAHGWTVSVTEGRAGGARLEFTGVDTAR